ncbi:MAG: F0F1 ATP synthase subunit B [Candidatus Curtissbacteria bacterium]|nr:F0F1 ATP synthase subunit B [Candidatus Curtissbacteria bacterium]
MEIAKQFGIEPILLLAQIINFLVILFVLKKFFYKPLVKMLADRKARIAESLRNADTIEGKLKATEEKSALVLDTARKNAEDILTDAKAEAQRIADAAGQEAKTATEQTLKKAMEQIQSEREKMQKDLEQETLDLVTATVKKVLGRNLRDVEKKSLTAKSIADITRKMSS